MTTRQNETNAFPGWFRNLIWFAGVVVVVVIYDNTRHATISDRLTKVETELIELKKKYSEDVKEILKNTAEIKEKLSHNDQN